MTNPQCNNNDIPQYLIGNEICIYLMARLAVNGYDYSCILRDQGVRNVVVYGVGKIGSILVGLLKLYGVSIPYCIDRDINKNCNLGIDVRRTAKDIDEDIDMIIISSDLFYYEILNDIREYSDKLVLRASDLIEELSIYPIYDLE